MAKRENVFSEEIELSEIVLEKTNHDFEMIMQEEVPLQQFIITGGEA